MKYYIDTCIWLNLFQKEGDSSKGTPYWKIAEDFLTNNTELFTSTIVLKELQRKIHMNLINKFLQKVNLIRTKSEDYDFARQIESENMYQLSFGDCMHIAICKRLQFTLITRDRNLISVSKQYIQVSKPETLY
jgi:predicted nucleic acid-binding protein